MASATRLSLMGNHFGNVRNTGNFEASVSSIPSSVKRKSLISTPRSGRRKTSMYSSQGSEANRNPYSSQREEGIYSQQSVFNQTSSQMNDTRPIKDKQYQSLIQGEIYEFLRLNKFEIEMNHPLTTKTLKQPTQKDFILIFQFLYNKLDPYYKFTKSIETEVFTILKLLNYPYLEGINRSQISAVGGTYWPTFLAMLYWLVKLNLQISELNTIELTNVNFDDKLNEIHENYIKGAFANYSKFSNEDESELLQEFQKSCQQIKQEISKDIEKHNIEHEQLVQKFNELEKEFKVYDNQVKKSKALENDLVKFKAYIETMELKKSDWYKMLDEIQSEIDNYRKNSEVLKQEISTYETNLKSKGLDIETINKLNNERNDLSKKIDMNNDKLEEISQQLQMKQIDLKNKYESLENFIRHYNNFIYKIQFKNHHNLHNNYNFEIKLNDKLWDLSTSFNQSEILQDSKNLKDEKVELIKFKNKISVKIHEIEDSKIKLQEQIDLINESIIEQRDELESLASSLSINKINYDQLYGTISDKSTTFATKIEKLTREINSMKVDTNSEYVAVLHQYNDVSIESENLKSQLHRERNSLHNKIQLIIENTISFKLNIQLNLQDLEELVIREMGNES